MTSHSVLWTTSFLGLQFENEGGGGGGIERWGGGEEEKEGEEAEEEEEEEEEGCNLTTSTMVELKSSNCEFNFYPDIDLAYCDNNVVTA